MNGIIQKQKQLNNVQINNIVRELYNEVNESVIGLPEMYSKRIQDEGEQNQGKIAEMVEQLYTETVYNIENNEKYNGYNGLKDEANDFRKEVLTLLDETKRTILGYVRESSLNTTYLPGTMSLPVFKYDDRTECIEKIQEFYQKSIEELKMCFDREDKGLLEEIKNSSQKEKNPTYQIDINNIEDYLKNRQIRTSGVRESVKTIRDDKQKASNPEISDAKRKVMDLFR